MVGLAESGEVRPGANALTKNESQPSLDERTTSAAKQRFPRTTINARLIAIVLTLAVPLNIVVAAVIWSLASAASATQRASLLYSARSIAASVDAELGKYIALAQVLSRSPALQEDSIDAIDSELRQQLSGDQLPHVN